jgi:hypothetical protein
LLQFLVGMAMVRIKLSREMHTGVNAPLFLKGVLRTAKSLNEKEGPKWRTAINTR